MLPNLELKLIAGALLAAGLLAGALYLVHRGVEEQKGRDAAAALAKQQKDAAETERRVTEQARIANDATVQADAARADAVAAGRARDALRVQLNAYVANARAAHPTASTASEAGDPIGVLAEVLGSADDFAGRVAAEADANRIAGLACERSYDALNHGKDHSP